MKRGESRTILKGGGNIFGREKGWKNWILKYGGGSYLALGKLRAEKNISR